jgi:hypothetical protein
MLAARRWSVALAGATRVKLSFAVACGLVVGVPAAALASAHSVARAVVSAQVAETSQEQALSKCLAASPKKNTPCIVREAHALANLDATLIESINSAMDGNESGCVRSVAEKELAYLALWRSGSLALATGHRTKAKALFVKSLPLVTQIQKIEPGCFAHALA